MGMQNVGNRIANYKRVDNGFFWEGARTQIGKGWLLFLISLLVPILIIFNIYFYVNSGSWLPVIGFAWLWLLLLSLMIGQYIFPLFWQQDEPNIWLTLRNATAFAVEPSEGCSLFDEVQEKNHVKRRRNSFQQRAHDRQHLSIINASLFGLKFIYFFPIFIDISQHKKRKRHCL